MSITQHLAHWFIALGLEPAMGALLALILLVAVPLMISAGVVAIFEAIPVFTGSQVAGKMGCFVRSNP